jgi:hypothetical protein
MYIFSLARAMIMYCRAELLALQSDMEKAKKEADAMAKAKQEAEALVRKKEEAAALAKQV